MASTRLHIQHSNDMPPIPPLTPVADEMVQAVREHKPMLKFECEDHVRGLVQFITANNEQYCQYIRGLHFVIGAVSEDVAAMLEYCIAQCAPLMPLEYLRFDDAEALLGSDPRLPDAFAALTTIKTLHVENVGRCADKMLMDMKSSVLSAELSLSDEPSRLPDELYYSDPIYLLSASQDTLRKVKASGATTDIPGDHWQRYPNMHVLELDFVDVPHTHDYVAAFPNLRHLIISSALPFTGQRNLPRRCEAYRKANQEEQEEHETWESLERVTGTLMDVYVLGLRCSVHALELDTISPLRGEGCLSMLESVIEDTKPTDVRLTANVDRILDDAIIFALSGEEVAKLRFGLLEIIVKVDCNILSQEVCEVVDCIVMAIRKLSIDKLYLTFDAKGTGTRTDAPTASEERNYLSKANLKYLGSRIIGRVTRLHYIRVSVLGLRPREHAYAVLGSVGRARMISVDDEEVGSDLTMSPIPELEGDDTEDWSDIDLEEDHHDKDDEDGQSAISGDGDTSSEASYSSEETSEDDEVFEDREGSVEL